MNDHSLSESSANNESERVIHEKAHLINKSLAGGNTFEKYAYDNHFSSGNNQQKILCLDSYDENDQE